jgi:hypothetical protein
MWTAISKCEQLFPNVNNYFQIWTAISKCEQLFSKCAQLFPHCEQLFPNLNSYFQMWTAISKSAQLFPHVNSYFQMCTAISEYAPSLDKSWHQKQSDTTVSVLPPSSATINFQLVASHAVNHRVHMKCGILATHLNQKWMNRPGIGKRWKYNTGNF